MEETKQGIIDSLNAYASTPDDDAIRCKEVVKQELLNCPTLLYLLNNKNHAGELFNEDGTLNREGEWDLYFNDNIRPYMFFPETQTESKNFLCYKVETDEISRFNAVEKIMRITFVVLCDVRDVIDLDTGIARHDLIASVIRERFNWSNIFGSQIHIVSHKETVTDTNYVTRTLIFESTTPNSIVQTDANGTRVINNTVRLGLRG